MWGSVWWRWHHVLKRVDTNDLGPFLDGINLTGSSCSLAVSHMRSAVCGQGSHCWPDPLAGNCLLSHSRAITGSSFFPRPSFSDTDPQGNCRSLPCPLTPSLPTIVLRQCQFTLKSQGCALPKGIYIGAFGFFPFTTCWKIAPNTKRCFSQDSSKRKTSWSDPGS
jgi:hypothetical protein